MRLFILSLIAAIGFLGTGVAKAEYGCQSGFVPVYQGNRQVCVADYNLPAWKQQGQQQQPAEVWRDRYGAVARLKNSAQYFVSVDQASEKDAKNDALGKCGSSCAITHTFRNTCYATSWGGGTSYFEFDDSKSGAEKKVLAICNAKKGDSCELLFSACSLPVRVQ